MSKTLSELAELTGTELRGDGSCVIQTVADIEHARDGAISFVSDLKYKKFIGKTDASALIVNDDLVDACDLPVLVSDNPRLTYAQVANVLFPPETFEPHISSSASISDSASIGNGVRIDAGAVIDDGASIGDGCYVGANAVVGREVTIGSGTTIRPNVTIGNRCRIGSDCLLHAGSVLGADGFGFVRHTVDGKTENLKIPQTSRVILGDRVEIGACTTIDRGALEDTVIADGVKLDNQIQIGHSVRIGENTIISAASAVGGSTTIGADCMIGGCAAIRDHITVADRVMITARTLVTHSLTEPGVCVSSGTPMDDTVSWRKNTVRFRQLDSMARRMAELEKRLDASSEKE